MASSTILSKESGCKRSLTERESLAKTICKQWLQHKLIRENLRKDEVSRLAKVAEQET
mgnify:CR=1 FL=1